MFVPVVGIEDRVFGYLQRGSGEMMGTISFPRLVVVGNAAANRERKCSFPKIPT